MNDSNRDSRRMPGLVVATVASLGLLLVLATLTTGRAAGGQAGESSAWHRCRGVVVEFEPEGGGGALRLRSKGIGCRRTRRVVRRCIKGNLTRGWTGTYRKNWFILRKRSRRIRYVPVGGGGCIPVRSGASDTRSGVPKPPGGSNRVRSFRINLDRDRRKERVLVYNRERRGIPATYFESWNRGGRNWRRVQRKLVTQIPSYGTAGLRDAWVGDLNRDGRVEIAVRDYFSPSFGEVLSIFRQRSRGSKRFGKLQGLGGDRVTVRRRRAKPARLRILRLAHHSPDNLEHNERWDWSKRAGRWVCATDCAL